MATQDDVYWVDGYSIQNLFTSGIEEARVTIKGGKLYRARDEQDRELWFRTDLKPGVDFFTTREEALEGAALATERRIAELQREIRGLQMFVLAARGKVAEVH